jgi:hypothetical protein
MVDQIGPDRIVSEAEPLRFVTVVRPRENGFDHSFNPPTNREREAEPSCSSLAEEMEMAHRRGLSEMEDWRSMSL